MYTKLTELTKEIIDNLCIHATISSLRRDCAYAYQIVKEPEGEKIPALFYVLDDKVEDKWSIHACEIDLLRYLMKLANGITPGEDDQNPDVDYTQYEIHIENLPEEVTANNPVDVNVSLQPIHVGTDGYSAVRFRFDTVTKPEESTVTYKASDSLSQEITQINSGYWGPEEGFELTPDYQATTEWNVTFDMPGSYSIKFELYDVTTGEVITSSEVSVLVS